jgi:germination protein YpeB
MEDNMVLSIKKRTLIRLISFILAFIIFGFAGWIYSNNRTNKLKRDLVHKYESSLEEIADGIKNISVLLDKSLYVGTAYGMCDITKELESISGSIEGAMASFPSGSKGTESISKFVSQVSDFSAVLLKQSVMGNKITEKERDSLKSLSASAENINKHLEEALIVYNNSENWEGRVDSIIKGIEINDELSSDLDEMPETLSSTPKLIYDGPFSDHIDDRESNLLKISKEITEQKAKGIAADYLSSSVDALTPCGEEQGKMPSYCFTSGENYISITKNGGYVNYLRKTRDVEISKITTEEAIKIAEKYVSDIVKMPLVSTYYFTEENVCVINFAYIQGEVLCYTDLVKIGVALDNGEIVFYEARGYIMNHTSRTFSTPKYSVEQARDAVSKNLKINSEKMVIIPSGGKNETLCYEFSCSGEEGEGILVYINAQTLAEENIFILIKTNGAILTK